MADMIIENVGPVPVYNPFIPGFIEDPYPHYGELRSRNPVQHHPMGFWALWRYEDVSQVLRAHLSVEIRNMTLDPPGSTPLPNADHQPSADGLSMLDRDPPDHTRLRRLVSKAFTPRAVAALEPRIHTLVDAALERIARLERVDLITEFAFPLPFAVISEMLGMPETDHIRLRELAGWVVRSLEPVVEPEQIQAITNADIELTALVADAIAWKRRHPADDMLTALIKAEEDGDVLSDTELVAQVVLLYLAGYETTVNLIANGVLALLRNPEQFALLRARPDLDANAVEELLRYDSPVQLGRRITLMPYQVAGQTIPAGSFVLAGLASANRDPNAFGPDANRLRLDRPHAHGHLSFGSGIHHCLGAALARLEGRIAIGGLIRRFPTMALDGEVTWNGRINLRGPERLPIMVTDA
jgi:cytochrome P450